MKLKANEAKAGFTIFEIIIVVAVSVAIMSVVMANQSRFRRTLDLTNSAYETALAIREAQVYGTSVRGSPGNFESGYGIHINKTTPGSFFLFRDRSPASNVGNGKWDAGLDTLISTYKFRGNVLISNFCRIGPSAGFDNCWKDLGVGQQIDTMDIAFQRPDPAAKLSVTGCSACGQSVPTRSGTITLSLPNGDSRIIEILSNGQIAVK
jgi:type II secretory pathway pseudopilin PulG